MDVLFSYSFKIIAIGTILLASLASLVGIIKKKEMEKKQ